MANMYVTTKYNSDLRQTEAKLLPYPIHQITTPIAHTANLRREEGRSDRGQQSEPLSQGLGAVGLQHEGAHLTRVADRDVRHELHAASHARVVHASLDQTHAWGARWQLGVGQ